MDIKFKGIIPPVPTLLEDSNQIDKVGMEKLINFLIESGVQGLFFLGSGGEFSQMTSEFRKEVAEFAVKVVNGRVPVLIGTGTVSTEEVISLSIHASKIGADGVVVVNPYYFQLTEESLYEHYKKVARSIDLPIVVYNYPALTGQDLSPDFVTRLATDFPNIVGIKETVESIGHIREMILSVKKVRPDFSVFAGYDDHLFPTLSLGGDGAICASTNIAPELSVGIYKSFQSEDYKKAIQLHRQIAKIVQMYKMDSPFVNVIKEAIKIRGIDIKTYVLPPNRQLSNEKKRALELLIKEILKFVNA